MTSISNPDNIYARYQKAVQPFAFDSAVADVFPDMIGRSVPGYGLTLPLIGLIAERYAQPNSNCYDLGCSLGAVTLAMRQRIRQPRCTIIGIDNSAAMLAKCRELLTEKEKAGNEKTAVAVELHEADIRDWPIERASVVVFNFTLQFIPPSDRNALLQRIYDGMLPNSALILSEKVRFSDADKNERIIDLHHAFKRANGYTDLEVSQKRTALENVLIPETIEQHQARLKSVGFATADVWFQAFNFVSLLAIKKPTTSAEQRLFS